MVGRPKTYNIYVLGTYYLWNILYIEYSNTNGVTENVYQD